jgi:hypothetical protein
MILFMSWSDTLAGYGLGEWASWASILGLAFTVFVSWKLLQIVRAIGKDRLSIERIQHPIEIYSHIRQTLLFLERLRSQGRLEATDDRTLSHILRGLQKSEDHLEHYFDFVSDLRPSGENAFLCAGRHYRSRGDAERAALHLERGLELNGELNPMTEAELKECVAELRICYLATFDVEGIYRLERRAEHTLKLKDPIEKIEPGASFHFQCLCEWLAMHMRATMRPFLRRRKLGTKIVKIHGPSA